MQKDIKQSLALMATNMQRRVETLVQERMTRLHAKVKKNFLNDGISTAGGGSASVKKNRNKSSVER